MPWHRGSKKWRQTQKRIHDERKDKPAPRHWWEPEPEPWEPWHVTRGRERAYYKRREQKRHKERGFKWKGRFYPYLTDAGVPHSASKRKHHRRHEIKPYKRPVKGSRG